MAYDADFWRQRGNWSALTGALTGAATRNDYPAMVRHIEAARAAGMPEEQIRRAYGEVVKMLPGLPALEALRQSAGGAAPAVSPAPAPNPATATSTTTTGPSDAIDRPADVADPATGNQPPASAATGPAPSDSTTEPADPAGRPVVQQLDYWLTLLRTGDDAQKIEARENLSLIFEQRSLFAEAIEMLEGNVWAGVRDAGMQRRLAALYRQIGRQDLADKAISDLYQLGMTGAASAPTGYAGGSANASPYRTEATAATAVPDASVAAAPEPAPEPPLVAPAWRRPRPVWLTVALMVATFGLYGYYWLFASWRELKSEADDRTMHPFWHAFGIAIIPIYGWIQFYAHMRAIRRQAILAGTGTTLSPGFCA